MAAEVMSADPARGEAIVKIGGIWLKIEEVEGYFKVVPIRSDHNQFVSTSIFAIACHAAAQALAGARAEARIKQLELFQ